MTQGALTRWEKGLLCLFFAGWIAFGVLVEIRSAFLKSRRYGDLGVYTRAAWAIREGISPYDITDSNGWHYHYPPLYAILMGPFAEPPPEHATGSEVPFAISVAACYLISLLCLAVGVHALASALEERSRHAEVRDGPAFTRRWWLSRLLPVLICLPPIGHTLMRGQINLIVLLCVCLAAAAMLRDRRLWSGVWLALAACLKIYPAYLFLYPLARRDWRCLAGCGLGLLIGLIAVPVLRLGPTRTAQLYKQQFEVVILRGLGASGDSARDKELMETTATDSQSFVAMIHNSLHLDRDHRPNEASPVVRRAHWLAAAVFTLLTLAAVWRRPVSGPGVPLFLGALTLVMILTSPVCHTHYFVLLVPLIMGLMAWEWEKSPDTSRPRPLLIGLFLIVAAGQALPLFPGASAILLKDIGLASYTSLALWLTACVVLRRSRPGPSAIGEQPLARAA